MHAGLPLPVKMILALRRRGTHQLVDHIIWSRKRIFITCKRGNIKHNVKDDYAFLWKHTTFGNLPNRKLSTDQYEIL
jgi:hypothetical protein